MKLHCLLRLNSSRRKQGALAQVRFPLGSVLLTGADPGIFERGGPEAIIYKILERGGPKSLKMAFECSFQSLSYKSFANITQKGGAQAPWAPPLNPPLAYWGKHLSSRGGERFPGSIST